MLPRLATFSNCSFPKDSLIIPIALARMGYAYNSESNAILCSNCKFEAKNFNINAEVITDQHHTFCSTCQYSKTENIPNADDLIQLKCDFSDNNGSGFDTNFLNISKETKTAEASSENEAANIDNVDNFTKASKLNDKFNNYEKIKETVGPQLQKTIENIRDIIKRRTEESNNESNDALDSGPGATRTVWNPGVTSFEIQQHAKHPGLANREERVRTFRGQDHRYSRSNLPDIIRQLVDAGLYYVGPTDNVRCFFCDGGLKNFSPDDNPFTEHQKWFPQCKYVKYLEEINQRRPALERDAVDNRTTRAATSLHQITTTVGLDFARPVRVLEPREIKARLETPSILKLQEMGYKKDNIRQALERRFALTGDDYESIEDLVRDLILVQGVIPSPNLSSDSVRTVNVVSNPRPQPQLQVAATASAASASKYDGTDGAGLVASAAVGPNLAAQDVLRTLRNADIEEEDLDNLFITYEQLTAIRTCQVCLENEISTVFLPCGHYVCCDVCTPKLSHCCICRSLIRGTVKALTSVSPK